MTIFLPDLDIGRCKNVRHHHCPCGYSEALRCLDYEGTKHTCEFPEVMHVCSMTRVDNQHNSYTIQTATPKPKPWVKPTSGRTRGEAE